MPRPSRRNPRRLRPRVERRAPRPPDGNEAPAPPQARDVHVDLAGHTVRLAELRAHPERYRAWFTRARHCPGHARCLCRRGGERLVIRELAGRFHLARWPSSTGDNHRPGCPFFLPVVSRHSGARPAGAAITVTEHGTRIALGYAFTTDVPADEESTSDPHAQDAETESVETLAGGPRAQTATLTGLGLLHWLWENAGLNTWPDTSTRRTSGATGPAGLGDVSADEAGSGSGAVGRSRRGWSEVHAALLPTVAGLRLGEQPAPALLHVVAPYRPTQPDPAREARLAEFLRPLEHPEHSTIRGGPRRGQRRLRRHRRLLLAEAKTLKVTAHGHKLGLRHFPRPVFLTTGHRDQLQRRFPAVFSDRPGPGARRIVLALIEGSPHGYLRLVDAAVMLASSDYIPAESNVEVALADKLADAGREFTKPLRHAAGPVSPDAVLPDVVLTDTEPATVVELVGSSGRAHDEARRHAQRHADEGVPVIAWDATKPPPLALARPDP